MRRLIDGWHPAMSEVVDAAGPGEWWYACESPEREPDWSTVWSHACDRCMIHLVAAHRHDPDYVIEHFKADGVGGHVTTISEALAMARAWREQEGMRPL